MFKNDTIAAIATASSGGSIAIIRVSGPDAIELTKKHIRLAKGTLSEAQSHTIHYGHVMDGDEVLDEVMVSVFKAPRSYTTEDVVEINCHGGQVVVYRVLDLLLQNGIRAAEPGEFTKRAFMNGRIDLSQAEAVMELIETKSELSRKNAVNHLNGNIKNKISSLRAILLHQIAAIEAALDDPEHMSLEGGMELLVENVDFLLSETDRLIDSFEDGRRLSEGIHTVIVGKPNAGKSSVLNRLLGQERAIVTEIAGTTRDVIEESMKLGSVALNICDTAGIHKTEDKIEQIGVRKSLEEIDRAELILYVVDSSDLFGEEDEEIIEAVRDKTCVLIINKNDLHTEPNTDAYKERIKNLHMVSVSALTGDGFEKLGEVIEKLFFAKNNFNGEEIVITSLRQKNCIVLAHEALMKVKQSIEDEMPEDFYSIDMMDAYAYLGEVIGEEIKDDLADEIFSKFCMGK